MHRHSDLSIIQSVDHVSGETETYATPYDHDWLSPTCIDKKIFMTRLLNRTNNLLGNGKKTDGYFVSIDPDRSKPANLISIGRGVLAFYPALISIHWWGSTD